MNSILSPRGSGEKKSKPSNACSNEPKNQSEKKVKAKKGGQNDGK